MLLALYHLQEQRKIWEDHRRRSVFLDEQAAAAEKAANEANRRQSHLYMSMALAQPQPQPYVQPMLWANGIPNTPYGMQQAPLFLQPQVQQPVYNARPTIMHSRPTSYYHQGQTTNGQSGQILNGQSSISYGQYVVGPPYQNQMR